MTTLADAVLMLAERGDAITDLDAYRNLVKQELITFAYTKYDGKDRVSDLRLTPKGVEEVLRVLLRHALSPSGGS